MAELAKRAGFRKICSESPRDFNRTPGTESVNPLERRGELLTKLHSVATAETRPHLARRHVRGGARVWRKARSRLRRSSRRQLSSAEAAHVHIKRAGLERGLMPFERLEGNVG